MSLHPLTPVRLLSLLFLGFLIMPAVGHSAGPIYWDWPQGHSFEDLTWEGVGLDRDGRLIPGPAGRDQIFEGSEVCWSVIPDGDGGFYTGTGHTGRIHHTAADGKSRLVTVLETTEIFSLLLLPDGALLAGCGPDGRLFRIEPSGQSRLLGEIPGGYIWSMHPVGDTVYLACGSPASLYRLDGDTPQLVTALPARNALDLDSTPEGKILVCTQGPGLVYELDPARPQRMKVLCETEQDEVRQFVRGPGGQVFFLALRGEESEAPPEAAPRRPQPLKPGALIGLSLNGGAQPDRAVLYRLDADGSYHRVWAGDRDLMIVAHSDRWGWLGGGTLDTEAGLTRIYRLEDQGGTHLLARWEGGDILDLRELTPGTLLVAQAHPGGVRLLEDSTEERATIISPPLDAGRPVAWGRLRFEGEGEGIELSVRVGNRSLPDAFWSDWSSGARKDDQDLDLPATRYLQWRARWPRKAASAPEPARLAAVSVSARRDNRAPSIVRLTLEDLTEVSEGGLLNGKENVTQSFASGLRVEFGRKSQRGKEAGMDRSAFSRPVRVLTWQGHDPDGDELLYRLDYRNDQGQEWRTIQGENPEILGSWDTSAVPDGRYRLRLTVSDHLSNPAGAGLSAEREVGPVVVDNTPPEIVDFRLERVDDGMRLRFNGRDTGHPLAEAWLVRPDGVRLPLEPRDGICDSLRETFDTLLPWPLPGLAEDAHPGLLTVEIWDLAGNRAVMRGEAR